MVHSVRVEVLYREVCFGISSRVNGILNICCNIGVIVFFGVHGIKFAEDISDYDNEIVGRNVDCAN